MFGLSGIRCEVCGMAQENELYRKEQGEGLYYTNPKLNPYTDKVLHFCGPQCSTKWTLGKMEASKDVTPGT